MALMGYAAQASSGVALGDTPTWTGAHAFTKNGALSLPTLSLTGTWITGGTATTTKPFMLIEPTGTTSNAWSTSGTALGINAASGFTGDLISGNVAGAQLFRVSNTGAISLNGGLFAQGAIPLYTQAGGSGSWGINYSANGAIQVSSTGKFEWSDSAALTGTPDTLVRRALAKVISVEGASSTGATFRHIATSPAQITADQNNYAPGGTSKFLRLKTDAARTLTGLSLSQVDGQEHIIVNVGSNNIVLSNESVSSTAANRFTNSTAADITLSAKQAADLVYDGTTSRWLVFKRN